MNSLVAYGAGSGSESEGEADGPGSSNASGPSQPRGSYSQSTSKGNGSAQSSISAAPLRPRQIGPVPVTSSASPSSSSPSSHTLGIKPSSSPSLRHAAGGRGTSLEPSKAVPGPSSLRNVRRRRSSSAEAEAQANRERERDAFRGSSTGMGATRRGETDRDEKDEDEEEEEWLRHLRPPPRILGDGEEDHEWGLPTERQGIVDPALEAKLNHFHHLKRTRGTHFNQSLTSNRSFRNPHIYDKLVQFVDVDERGSNFDVMVDGNEDGRVWSAGERMGELKEMGNASRLAEMQKAYVAEREAQQAPGKRSAIDFASSSTSHRAGGSAGAERESRSSSTTSATATESAAARARAIAARLAGGGPSGDGPSLREEDKRHGRDRDRERDRERDRHRDRDRDRERYHRDGREGVGSARSHARR